MKMFYGNTPVKSLNIKHYELNTNDCTAIPSDLQSGITCVAKGKKITGTGKSFEFANCGQLETNSERYVPDIINVIEVTSVEYPIRHLVSLTDMKNSDFSIEQTIGIVLIDNVEYPLVVKVTSNILTVTCEQTFYLQVFYGKDNYV